jgi:hypothetical protein
MLFLSWFPSVSLAIFPQCPLWALSLGNSLNVGAILFHVHLLLTLQLPQGFHLLPPLQLCFLHMSEKDWDTT